VKVIWSPLAIERVVEIADWIAASRPQAASELVEGLFMAVERLTEFPEIGRQVPDFERPDLREIVYRRYRIIYRVRSDRVEILTVRHSLQDLEDDDLTK
jgi:toxin ParE1/3/4